MSELLVKTATIRVPQHGATILTIPRAIAGDMFPERPTNIAFVRETTRPTDLIVRRITAGEPVTLIAEAYNLNACDNTWLGVGIVTCHGFRDKGRSISAPIGLVRQGLFPQHGKFNVLRHPNSDDIILRPIKED